MREVPEIVDRAVDTREWERDRKAWNLPRASREAGAASANQFTDGIATAADVPPRASHGAIQGLPQDISELDRDELRKASNARDERILILFRRWPALTRIEMKELRQLHDERQRLARCIGLLRDGRHGRSRAHLKACGPPVDWDDGGRIPKAPPAPSGSIGDEE